MKKKTYQQPEMKVVEIDHADIICTSMTSPQNEEYGDGTTTDWY